ncbi:hypothetical protein RE411_04665 [Agrobacterium pusense]|uniref:hypothetical protein n=1 Tax=Agrobacterium pusense TaxID=648995 RepID=UPI002867E991|nr:hypothetical protein [Agrobacterium pusense]WMW56481.1 hypothetical protein RE411_04665 [Agrobacterium pusense]
MWKLIPDWVKLGVAAVVGAALLSIVSFQVGKREGKSVAQIEAAKEAVNRINNQEKNNASFRNMSDRHRCLVFMRDSKLPDSNCD